jgi:flagella basal body P-ring formation protein FlgA
MPAARMAGALITSPAGLAGQAARRPLRAKTPLFAYDVKKPVVVKKGELITVVYAMDGIQLTLQGQAQADGGKDDAIPVINTRSRRTIEARVAGPGMAIVSGPAATLAAIQ